MLIIESEEGILLEQRPPTGIWGGLWSFPELSDTNPEPYVESLGYIVAKSLPLPALRHTFTHYHLDIEPLHLLVEAGNSISKPAANNTWFDRANPGILALSGVVTKILKSR